MTITFRHPLSERIYGKRSLWLISICAGLGVFVVSLLLQSLIYHHLLDAPGPLRLIGSTLAGALTFAFTFRWRSAKHERQFEMWERFETIARMNDRIRNALQIIECATYARNTEATDPVRHAVDRIEIVLTEVVVESQDHCETKQAENNGVRTRQPTRVIGPLK